MAGTTIGAVDRGIVVAAVPVIVHFRRDNRLKPEGQEKFRLRAARLGDLHGSQNREVPVAWRCGYRWPLTELLLVDANWVRGEIRPARFRTFHKDFHILCIILNLTGSEPLPRARQGAPGANTLNHAVNANGTRAWR